VIAEKEGDRIVLYADNNEYCTVSVQLTLSLDNLIADESFDHIYIIPQGNKIKLVELSRIKKGRTGYAYDYKAVFGNVHQTNYDRNYVYDLPYKKGSNFRIDQGYNGQFTHQNENALDFNMPEGTNVKAARSGIVIAVVQQYSESCLREECKQMANHILILHSDGTIADYSHLRHNGALVQPGDSVNKGDPIALSGNTGYTRGPHLHFICFLPGIDTRRGIKTKFRTGNGTTASYLVEDGWYKRNY